MTATAVRPAPVGTPVEEPGTARQLRLVMIGHVVQALLWAGAFAGAAVPTAFALSTLERNALVFGGGAMAVLHALTALLVHRRRFRGRFLSLVLDYLTALAGLALVLSRMEVFTGLDEFAGAWQDAFAAVAGAIVAGLWIYAAMKLRDRSPGAARVLQLAGFALLAVSALAFVVLARVLPGLLTLLGRLLDPVTLALLVLTVATALLAVDSITGLVLTAMVAGLCTSMGRLLPRSATDPG